MNLVSGTVILYSGESTETSGFFQKTKLNTYQVITGFDEDHTRWSDVGPKMRVQQETKKTANISNKTTKKSRLLANPEIKRWYDNLDRGSHHTAEARLRKLGRFCEAHSMSPMELAELGMKDAKTVADLLQDHITHMEESGMAPQYIKGVMTTVKSWLDHHDIEIKRKLKISNVDATPTLENERVPEGEELAELFNRANLRSGAAMALIGKSGLRPEVLGNHDASDGLMIKDLPDLAIVQGHAMFLRTPARVNVRKTLSKTSREYFTFISEMGGKRILAYLNQRILDGEALTPETPIIGPFKRYPRFRGTNNEKKFAETQTILKEIRKTMRPRFSWRPYVLRALFDTQLLIAESRGKIAHDFRVFFMGHHGSIEAKYTTNKGILPKELVDEMRNAFKRSEEFLDIDRILEDPLEKKKHEMKSRLEGMTHEEIALVQEMLQNMDSCKTGAVSECQQQTRQNS